ncbi:hypothetical protein KJ611_03070 [Patescibacteria group bacterium]|nr:hypothetical protein [Patescibacteria group bacterium]MBU1705561.1 hypothetical protein [Patescibacteria group bacterium]
MSEHPQIHHFENLPEVPPAPEQPKVVQHQVQEVNAVEIQKAVIEAEAKKAQQAEEDDRKVKSIWDKIRGLRN